MLWLLLAAGVLALVHTAPFPFLLDTTKTTLWHMPQTGPKTIYLTFDDGPNPTATPALLDALKRHNTKATFFLIDKYLTPETAPIVRRMFDEGHAVALHSHTRALMFKTPSGMASTLAAAAARIEQMAGRAPCRAFRPHAGHRSVTMLMGAARAGYRVVGFGWMLFDFNWGRRRTADAIVPRFLDRAGPGDIVVIHDGHHKNPRADRQYAVETVDRLVPQLHARGFQFGVVCP